MTDPSDHGAVLISVIVPVYNSELLVERTVRSILDQTHSRLEVILVDDGSTDESPAICDQLAQLDDRIVVIHRPNGGIAAAQNAGLDVASGTLVTFCDNDDLMHPWMIERLASILFETAADMSCCRWLNVGASVAESAVRSAHVAPGMVAVIHEPARAYQTVFSLLFRKLRRRELAYFSEANWGKLYRAELWHDVRFPEGRYAQDVAVSMDLYLQMGSVASCSDSLYFWVQRAGSVSHSERATKYYHDIVEAHARSFEAAISAGITPARAYAGMMTSRLEKRSVRTRGDRELALMDARRVAGLVGKLSWSQRAQCAFLYSVRRFETLIYRMTVHRRR